MNATDAPARSAPKRSPWGPVQHATAHGPFWSVSCAGHGGLRVFAKENAQIKFGRRESGWYEEDCEWAIVAMQFPQHFSEENQKAARDTVRNWFPEVFEALTGTTLKAGESYRRDEKIFNDRHMGDMVVVSATGDWNAKVPKGKVGVLATRGGSRVLGAFATGQWYLVDAVEYEARNHFGFVIDEARHKRIDPL